MDLIIAEPTKEIRNGKEVIIQKLPVMCIGEYGDVTPYGRKKAKVVMTPFLYYPEVDYFYVDLPADYNQWELNQKKEHFITLLHENQDYLSYSEHIEYPTQLGKLTHECHQGKLLKELLDIHDLSFHEGHRRISQLMKIFKNNTWNDKSLVVPSKAIFIDKNPQGDLKVILYQMNLRDYASCRSVEDFLQHRINILGPELLENKLEKIVAILLGAVWELNVKENKYEDIAYDYFDETSSEDISETSTIQEHVCHSCRLRQSLNQN